MIVTDAIGNDLNKDDMVIVNINNCVFYGFISEIHDKRLSVIFLPWNIVFDPKTPQILNITKVAKPPQYQLGLKRTS